MSNQMSPPPRPASRPFSPTQQTAHAPPGIMLPPAKRQRLSPGIGSPQAANGAFPESPYSSYPTPNATSPPAFNAPQPYLASPPAGAMGPPPRPTAEQRAAREREEKEKVTDISDISDAMWGSGVDLREEENYLSSAPSNNFRMLTQSTSLGQLPGTSRLSEAASIADVEVELDRKHQEAAVAYAKQHEQHLRHPFLLANTVRHKMHKIAVDQAVRLDIKGLYEPAPVDRKPPDMPQGVNGVQMAGSDNVGIVAARASSIPTAQHALLEETSKYADMLSLISIATNDRIRSLLNEAYAISRGRQLTSHGVVPPDMQDIATGQDRRSVSVKAESITGSAWDRPKSATIEPTVSFTSRLPIHLSAVAASEHAAERARIKRRAERAKRLAAAASDEPAEAVKEESAAPPDGVADASGTGLVAPDKPLTKKEREKMAKAGQTDEVLHKNANTTAAMQLGFGKKKKTYSWMTGSGGAAMGGAPSNPFARPAASSRPSNVGASALGVNGGSSETDGSTVRPSSGQGLGREIRYGAFKEEPGLQLRDLLTVLERDGKHRKTLERGWARLDHDVPG